MTMIKQREDIKVLYWSEGFVESFRYGIAEIVFFLSGSEAAWCEMPAWPLRDIQLLVGDKFVIDVVEIGGRVWGRVRKTKVIPLPTKMHKYFSFERLRQFSEPWEI